MKYSLNIIVNTPKDEHDLHLETYSIDETVQRVLGNHPKCTSMVITLCPMPLEPVMDESGQSAGFEPVSCPPKAETNGQRLSRLYPEHYVRIITLVTEEVGGPAAAKWLSKINDFGHTLACAFDWYDTTEGHEFWKELSKREEQ